MLISGVRIIEVTSSPLSRTRARSPGMKSIRVRPARSLSFASSRVSMFSRVAASASARYIAPVSICGSPSSRATARLVVVLPTPDGPSMAMIRVGMSAYRRALLRDGRAPARRTAGFFEPLDFPAATFGRGDAGRGDGVRRVELRVSVRDAAERFAGAFERDAAGFRVAAAAGFLRDTG